METIRSELAGCPVIIGGGLAGHMTALDTGTEIVCRVVPLPAALPSLAAGA